MIALLIIAIVLASVVFLIDSALAITSRPDDEEFIFGMLNSVVLAFAILVMAIALAGEV